MDHNRTDSQPPATARPQPTTLLLRLALVIAGVVVFIVLFKPATAVDRKLQVVLDAAAQAMRAGNWQAFEAVHDPQAGGWWEYQRRLFDSYQEAAAQAGREGQHRVFPDVEIVQSGRDTNTAWALVVVRGEVDGPRQIEFFHRVAGRWLRAAPEPTYWGDQATLQSLYFVWHYRQADDEWVRPLAPAVDAAWGRIAADLNTPLPSALIPIEVCYSFDCALDRDWDTARPYAVTPLLVGRSVEETQEQLVAMLVRHQASLLVGGGGEARAVGSPVLLLAIYTWESAQITGRAPEWLDPVLGDALAGDALLSLDDLSLTSPRGEQTVALAQGYTLVEYLVAQYGRGVLSPLLRAAGARSSVPIVLQDVLGSAVDIAALEQDWLNFLRTRYSP